MITPWYRAATYAATVTLASMAVQATVFLLLLLLSGNPAGDIADLLITPVLVFPFFSIAVLTATRLVLPALPRWRTAAIDTTLYTLVLLFVTIGFTASEGLADAVDFGFVMLTVGLLTLQLPAALAASALAQPRLLPVVGAPAPQLPASQPSARRTPA
ncbi:hypothetical protein PV390_24785 [Streptomyces sp. ME02-6991-2A]|uniref:hypothetical protein n=1 Tax=Streptomyces sp. ME02-6991-2A TaxID=3028677 RepID=UPI0010083597|nr:hypothetical protein [Streptomyces sp. ME02-6991-2A]MDX3377623.1 hypothetical protein [Streptomyces sp. ME02-6991-2A]